MRVLGIGVLVLIAFVFAAAIFNGKRYAAESEAARRAALTMPSAAPGPHSLPRPSFTGVNRRERVTAAAFGAAWPFTVSAVELGCDEAGAATLHWPAGATFALNPAAERAHWPGLIDYALKPGATGADIAAVRERAERLCI